MTTLITRDQMRPGQIVQRVTTYRVRSAQPGPAWKGRQGVRRLPVLAGPALTRGAR